MGACSLLPEAVLEIGENYMLGSVLVNVFPIYRYGEADKLTEITGLKHLNDVCWLCDFAE